MTKADFLNGLAAKVTYVGTPVDITAKLDDAFTQGGMLKAYTVSLIAARSNGTKQGQTQIFYVKDEGGAGEECWPVEVEREDEPVPQFEQDLKAYAGSLISATLIKIVFDAINNEHEFAIATAYEVSGDPEVVSSKRYFVVRDGAGGFTPREYLG